MNILKHMRSTYYTFHVNLTTLSNTQFSIRYESEGSNVSGRSGMSRAVSDGHIHRMNRVSLRLSGADRPVVGSRNATSLRDRSLIAIENYYTVQRFDLAQWTGMCYKKVQTKVTCTGFSSQSLMENRIGLNFHVVLWILCDPKILPLQANDKMFISPQNREQIPILLSQTLSTRGRHLELRHSLLQMKLWALSQRNKLAIGSEANRQSADLFPIFWTYRKSKK